MRTVDPGPVPPRDAAGWRPQTEASRRAFAAVFQRIRDEGADATSQHAFDAEPTYMGGGLPVLHTLHLPPAVPAVVEALRRVRPAAVAVSEAAGRAWRDAGVDVDVIPNGVPELDTGDPPVEPVGLVAGRIAPEKGTADAVRAIRAAGLRPLVVGDLDDGRYFEEEVAPLLREGERSGALERDDLRRLMARAMVLVAAVRWDEPFGLTAAEAQLAGCPVAGYRRGALPEVVAEGIGGVLAEPGTGPKGLADAIRATARLDRAAVRASARDRFSLERMVERYERRLLTVAKGRAS